MISLNALRKRLKRLEALQDACKPDAFDELIRQQPWEVLLELANPSSPHIDALCKEIAPSVSSFEEMWPLIFSRLACDLGDPGA